MSAIDVILIVLITIILSGFIGSIIGAQVMRVKLLTPPWPPTRTAADVERSYQLAALEGVRVLSHRPNVIAADVTCDLVQHAFNEAIHRHGFIPPRIPMGVDVAGTCRRAAAWVRYCGPPDR